MLKLFDKGLITPKTTLLTLIVVATLVGCVEQNAPDNHLKIIKVDTNEARTDMDISDMLDLSTVEIIKLETSDNSLVSSRSDIVVTENYIFVGNRMTPGIIMFNRDGSYVGQICARGRGPGEYNRLLSFAVVGDSVYVNDGAQTGTIVYPVRGKGFRKIPMTPHIYYVDMFSNGDRLWFVTDYSTTLGEKMHSANLVSMDSKSGDRAYHIPFDPEIEEKALAWGVHKPSSTNGDETLVIFGRNDTIYSVRGDNVRAKYFVDFTRDKMPESLLQQEALTAFPEAINKGYNTGLNTILNLNGYIIGQFHGNKVYEMVYDKQRDEVSVGDGLVIGDMGSLQILDMGSTANNELVAVYETIMLKSLWEHRMSKKEFANPTLKEAMRQTIESSEDDDNPILVILKLK
jgi:hypothetical protein